MTKEQVLVAVSYPPTHKTPSLDQPMWQHWQSRAGRFEVYWGGRQGRPHQRAEVSR
jgi:hypothetical protein